MFPVDFYADEMFVEEIGSGGILEGFVCHDVAPVTGRIANTEEDWLVFPPGFLECGRIPGIPVHRVAGVLAQVRGKRVGEVVGHRFLPEIPLRVR